MSDQTIPRSPDGDNKRQTLTLNLQPTSKWDRKAATNGFPMAVVAFGPNRFPTEATWSCQRLPHHIERAPQNVRTGGGYALHRERFYKNYNPDENIGKQLRTSENI